MNRDIKLYKLIQQVLNKIEREEHEPLEVILYDPRDIRNKLRECLEILENEED